MYMLQSYMFLTSVRLSNMSFQFVIASRLALLAGRSSPDAERAARADLDLGLATRAQAQEVG